MKKMIIFFIISLMSFRCSAQSVNISYNDLLPQIKYAVKILQKSLQNSSHSVTDKLADFSIILSIDPDKIVAEAFSITPRNKKIIITGGDGTGIIYGCLSVAEDLRNGIPIQNIKDKTESPKLQFRAIKFDLPWDTYRHSTALDLHQSTCKNLKFWEAFLDMMCENRFNVLTLWNLHPYTFLIKPENFPEASPWTDEEMREWKNLFSGIFRMAKERGIDSYIMPFNIFVTPEFSKAHNVAMNNLDHNHYVDADTSKIIKRYTRECVTQMLNEYPDLSGIGLTLGEGMGGMTPEKREDWMSETIIEGMRLANRKSKLIHRIPFSGNTASLGATTIEMEQITRKRIERQGDMSFIEGPVWAGLKFNWSHAHSTTKLIKVHGGKLYGTYFSPEPVNYKIFWTARNEDFFCLRWGDADFVRRHIIENSHSYVGGYMIGSETYIPAEDYFTKPGPSINWKYAFERQWLFYKIWGRLLYNSSTPDEVFRDEFIRRYGKEAGGLLEAYSLAGRTPLRLASSYDCTWDFTLYSEGFMALVPETRTFEYISVDRQINQPPLDTDYVAINKYVKTIISGGTFDSEKITPPALALLLEKDCSQALSLLKTVKSANPSIKYETADVAAWANLGLFFSEKIKGAVALQTYRITGKEENKREAVEHLESALSYWDKVIEITEPIYKDYPLVQYSGQDGNSYFENDKLRFHWRLIRPDVVKDIQNAKDAVFVNSN